MDSQGPSSRAGAGAAPSEKSRQLPAMPPSHLLVLVHGIGGGSANWSYTKAQFERSFGTDILIFCSSCVQIPHVGVDTMGKKLAEEVRGVVKAHPSLKRISFLSHSLGGVVSRYAVALLLDAPQPAASSTSVRAGRSASLFDSLESSQEEAGGGRNQGPRNGDDGARLAQEGGPADHTWRGGRATEAEACAGSEERGRQGQLPPGGEGGRGKGPPHWAQSAVHPSRGGTPPGRAAAALTASIPLPPLIEDVSFRSPRGSLPRRTLCGLEPLNFITMASPHLGSRAKGALPFLSMVGFLERASPTMGPWFLGQTAKHLFLTDAPRPLLLRMSSDGPEGPFISALASFKHRWLYSNVAGDQLVGWQTSSMRQTSDMPEVSCLKEDPAYKFLHILSSHPGTPLEAAAAAAVAAAEAEAETEAQAGGGREGKGGGAKGKGEGGGGEIGGPMKSQSVQMELKEEPQGLRKCKSEVGKQRPAATGFLDVEMEDVMAENLNQVQWRRVDVDFSATALFFLAHNLIQVKDYWIHKGGASVIKHIVDHFDLS